MLLCRCNRLIIDEQQRGTALRPILVDLCTCFVLIQDSWNFQVGSSKKSFWNCFSVEEALAVWDSQTALVFSEDDQEVPVKSSVEAY